MDQRLGITSLEFIFFEKAVFTERQYCVRTVVLQAQWAP
jgi:hypothetical protein